MKPNISRIMFCLAALDLPEDELHLLINELRSMPWEAISARVSALRQSNEHYPIEEDSSRPAVHRSRNQLHDSSVGKRVEQLLMVEAGLTAAQAAEKLALRLTELGIIVGRQDLPPVSKKSFRDWVGRVVRRVPSKDILRCATIIRNEYVHTPISDWKLSSPGE